MRQEVVEAVQVLNDLGDVNLHYVSGLELFGRTLLTCYPTTCTRTRKDTKSWARTSWTR